MFNDLISYRGALLKFNQNNFDRKLWAYPKKGTAGYNQIQHLRKGEEAKPAKTIAELTKPEAPIVLEKKKDEKKEEEKKEKKEKAKKEKKPKKETVKKAKTAKKEEAVKAVIQSLIKEEEAPKNEMVKVEEAPAPAPAKVEEKKEHPDITAYTEALRESIRNDSGMRLKKMLYNLTKAEEEEMKEMEKQMKEKSKSIKTQDEIKAFNKEQSKILASFRDRVNKRAREEDANLAKLKKASDEAKGIKPKPIEVSEGKMMSSDDSMKLLSGFYNRSTPPPPAKVAEMAKEVSKAVDFVDKPDWRKDAKYEDPVINKDGVIQNAHNVNTQLPSDYKPDDGWDWLASKYGKLYDTAVEKVKEITRKGRPTWSDKEYKKFVMLPFENSAQMKDFFRDILLADPILYHHLHLNAHSTKAPATTNGLREFKKWMGDNPQKKKLEVELSGLKKNVYSKVEPMSASLLLALLEKLALIVKKADTSGYGASDDGKALLAEYKEARKPLEIYDEKDVMLDGKTYQWGQTTHPRNVLKKENKELFEKVMLFNERRINDVWNNRIYEEQEARLAKEHETNSVDLPLYFASVERPNLDEDVATTIFKATYNGADVVLNKIGHVWEFKRTANRPISFNTGNKLSYTGRVISRTPLNVVRNAKGNKPASIPLVPIETGLKPAVLAEVMRGINALK